MTESVSSAPLVAESHPLGLAAAPFADTPDDAFFFPSDQHLRALEFMGHSLWTRARLGVVIAEHGCGKSYLIRRLIHQLDERIIAAAVQKEHIGPREFLLDILRQFGIALDDQDKTDRRRLLERFLNHQAALGRVCLLIIENAQSMHPSVLEELRCLAAIEADGSKVLKILLLGQHSLSLVLESPRMSELFTASVPRFSLELLSEDQTAAYVAHRLRAAGAENPDALIPHTLMRQIFACTRGVPGRINQLCERMLGCASEAGDRTIGARALDEAIEQLGWQDRRLPAATTAADMGHAWRNAITGPAKLVISMQGMADREVPLSSNRILVGRGEEADVRIDSVFVSRYHALIVRNGLEDLLLDLGSTNGVLVNSRRLVRRRLQHRDLVQIGPARVTYLNEAAAQNPQPDPGETLCFARPGIPMAAGDEDAGTLIAFGRLDSTGGD
jgi:general secretion pathway protein A